MSNIRVTGFKWVPPFAQGLVRDLRVRWALEEAGLPYSENLLGSGEQNSPEHRALQPFGQVPVYEEDGLTLFESGSILIHLGEKSEKLLRAPSPGFSPRSTRSSRICSISSPSTSSIRTRNGRSCAVPAP
jgi:glutathione S-transferase